jgi:hypothetical protein
MRQKRNPHNKLDLVGCLGDRVRKYRLDLGVGHLGLDRLRIVSIRVEPSVARRGERKCYTDPIIPTTTRERGWARA